MIYHLFANRSNIGDWLAARSIERLLGNPPLVELLVDDPFVEESLATLAKARTNDVLLIGGGGLLMDYFDPLWRGLAALYARPMVYIWGIGLVGLKRESSLPDREAVREVVRSSRLCVLRDEPSLEFVDLPGLPEPVACPSMAVIDAAPIDYDGVLHVASLTTVGERAYRAMRRTTMRWASHHNCAFRETDNRLARTTEQALEEAMSLYRRSKWVVSSGLHGCVIATAMKRPVIAVSGDVKIDAYMRMAGLQDWLLQPDETRRLGERIAALPDQPVVDEFIARTIDANRNVAAQILRDISPTGVAGAA